MKKLMFILIIVSGLISTIDAQTSQSFCYHVQLFEIVSGNQIYEADNNVNCTNNGPEFQTRPIYTCEALLLIPMDNQNSVPCGAAGSDFVFIEFFDLNNNLVDDITIYNNTSSAPPGCEFTFDISTLNLAMGFYNMVVHINNQTTGIMSNGNIFIINQQNPQIVESHTQTCNTNEVCFTFNSIIPDAYLADFIINFGDGTTSAICTPGTGGSWNCNYTICHTYPSSGTYQVSFETLDPPCPISPYTVVVKSPLLAMLNPNSYAGCTTGSPFSINATVSGGTIPYTYAWGVPAGDASPFGISPLNTASVTFNPTNAVNGNYTVTVTDVNNCTATAVFVNNSVPCCPGYNILTAHNTTFTDVTTAWLNTNFPYVTNNVMQVNALTSQIKVAFNGTLTVNTNFISSIPRTSPLALERVS